MTNIQPYYYRTNITRFYILFLIKVDREKWTKLHL